MTQTALYPGSFDPITLGHIDIIKRATKIVDRLIIAVGNHHEKNAFLDIETRMSLIQKEVEKISPNIDVISFDELVVDCAQKQGASILIRGLRNGTDFDYEKQMAGMNAELDPEIETIFLGASAGFSHISSTLVRQIHKMNGDISNFVSPSALKTIKENHS